MWYWIGNKAQEVTSAAEETRFTDEGVWVRLAAPSESPGWVEAQKKIFELRGEMCPVCARKIEMYLQSEPRVLEVEVSLAKRRLTVIGAMQDADVISAVETLEPGVTAVRLTKEDKQPRLRALDALAVVLGVIAMGWTAGMRIWSFHPEGAFFFLTTAGIFGFFPIARSALKALKRRTVDEHVLLVIAFAGALGMREFYEAFFLVLLYRIGNGIAGYMADRAAEEFRRISLGFHRRVRAVDAKGRTYDLAPEDVRVGQRVLVMPSESVPLDAYAESGMFIRTESMTGERAPHGVVAGAMVPAGAIVCSEMAYLKVARPYAESEEARLRALYVQASAKKSKCQSTMTRFAALYTPAVVAVACCIVVFSAWDGMGLPDAIHRGLTMLVASCPCALIIGIPLVFAGALSAMRQNGVFVRGDAAMERLAEIRTVLYDKTGTLTDKREEDVTLYRLRSGMTREQVMALMAVGEKHSRHPLAALFQSPDAEDPSAFLERPGIGIDFSIGSKRYWIRGGEDGAIVLSDDDGQIARIGISEAMAIGAIDCIRGFQAENISQWVLSGDHPLTVDSLRSDLAKTCPGAISVAMGGLSPEEKNRMLEREDLIRPAAFCGDGVNDGLLLARSDLSVAVGRAASDVAVESSDILLSDGLGLTFVAAYRLAKRTIWTMRWMIAATIGAKLGALIALSLGWGGMALAVFSDVGVAIGAVGFSLHFSKMAALDLRRVRESGTMDGRR